MKKTLLALATASALIVSGSALAAFADAPVGEGAGANAQIEITGALTNTNPSWMWQIPTTAQSEVTDVALKKISAVVNGANTEFAITHAPMNILEGYMKAPAAKGGAGLTPIIMVGGKDLEACTMSMGGCVVTVDATEAGKAVGTVDSVVALAGAYAQTNGVNTYTSGGAGGDTTETSISVLRLQSGFDDTYAGATHTYNEGNSLSVMVNDLMSAGWSAVSQSRVVSLESSKLIVPTNAVPATWAATLPITIALK